MFAKAAGINPRKILFSIKNVSGVVPELLLISCVLKTLFLIKVLLVRELLKLMLAGEPLTGCRNTHASIVKFVAPLQEIPIVPKRAEYSINLHLFTVVLVLELIVKNCMVNPINWQLLMPGLMVTVVKEDGRGACLFGLCPAPISTTGLFMVMAP